ncbi:uncharacterized protein [Leptinotarsa decemlineata]|uniref:uncharacterized protein n=1 Tax=Leptinotarsa decemlineata TaxID=7539 RepID=UPI003D3092A1
MLWHHPKLRKQPNQKKRKTNQMMAEEAYGVMNRLEKIGERDHCEVFEENVACQLRQMKDSRLQMVAKHRINQVLFEIGMSEFQPPDATSSPGSLLEATHSPTPSMYSSVNPHDADPESTQLHATNFPITSDFCSLLNFTQL